MNNSEKTDPEAKQLYELGPIGCISIILVFFGLIGGCVYMIGEIDTSEMEAQEEAFYRDLRYIDRAPRTEKPVLILKLYKDHRHDAYAAYSSDAGFRRATNDAIRLLFIVDYEKGISFCSQHTTVLGNSRFKACD